MLKYIFFIIFIYIMKSTDNITNPTRFVKHSNFSLPHHSNHQILQSKGKDSLSQQINKSKSSSYFYSLPV
jgi:hypothetical protein